MLKLDKYYVSTYDFIQYRNQSCILYTAVQGTVSKQNLYGTAKQQPYFKVHLFQHQNGVFQFGAEFSNSVFGLRFRDGANSEVPVGSGNQGFCLHQIQLVQLKRIQSQKL
ncbi:Hypothetical_protein [Hexamita inflata]|uniref:Hypothetical_protein n=1 Tax=Hexamita inflata TaxID=28002 RepID=A0ABP1HPT7_9EUKA